MAGVHAYRGQPPHEYLGPADHDGCDHGVPAGSASLAQVRNAGPETPGSPGSHRLRPDCRVGLRRIVGICRTRPTNGLHAGGRRGCTVVGLDRTFHRYSRGGCSARPRARSNGGDRARSLALIWCGGGHHVCGWIANRQAGLVSRLGANPMGGHAGAGPVSARHVPAGVAGVSGCQRLCDPAGQPDRRAACAGRVGASTGLDRPRCAPGHGVLHALAAGAQRSAGCGVAAACTSSMGCADCRRWRTLDAAAQRFSRPLGGR
jgi:hypothetical protein